MLEACRAAGVRVLGVEGFRIAGEAVQPDMDAILDLSDVLDPEVSVSEARRFLRAVADQELMFEIAATN
jgi:hypothetical protein